MTAAAGADLAVEDFRLRRTVGDENADKPALHPRQRMVDEGVAARDLEREFGDRGTTRRDAGRLDAAERLRLRPAQAVDLVEDRADDVERRGEIRAADAEEYAHRLADRGMHRMQRGERADRAVEHEVLRMLGEQLLDAEL